MSDVQAQRAALMLALGKNNDIFRTERGEQPGHGVCSGELRSSDAKIDDKISNIPLLHRINTTARVLEIRPLFCSLIRLRSGVFNMRPSVTAAAELKNVRNSSKQIPTAPFLKTRVY